MTENTENKDELVENTSAPEVFAGGAVGYAVIGNGSNVSITLATPRWNLASNRFDHVVIGRLCLPVAGAQGLALGLNDFLKSRGLDPTAAMTGGMSKQ